MTRPPSHPCFEECQRLAARGVRCGAECDYQDWQPTDRQPTARVSVPVEPTKEMILAGSQFYQNNAELFIYAEHMRGIWDAMLAATPAPGVSSDNARSVAEECVHALHAEFTTYNVAKCEMIIRKSFRPATPPTPTEAREESAATQHPVTPCLSKPGLSESLDSTNGISPITGSHPCERDSGDIVAPAAAPSAPPDLLARLDDMRKRWTDIIREQSWGDQLDGDIDLIAEVRDRIKSGKTDLPAPATQEVEPVAWASQQGLSWLHTLTKSSVGGSVTMMPRKTLEHNIPLIPAAALEALQREVNRLETLNVDIIGRVQSQRKRAIEAERHLAELTAQLARAREDERERFPVLSSHGQPSNHPKSVPLRWVNSFAAQCERNHSQTVARLAERGGLDPVELWHAANGKEWHGNGFAPPTADEANAWLRSEPWKDLTKGKSDGRSD